MSNKKNSQSFQYEWETANSRGRVQVPMNRRSGAVFRRFGAFAVAGVSAIVVMWGNQHQAVPTPAQPPGVTMTQNVNINQGAAQPSAPPH